MTNNLEKLIERRQGEFEHKIMSVDELGHQAHIGDAYKAIQFVNQTATLSYRQALLDLREGLPGDEDENVTFPRNSKYYANGHNTALQTVRAKIEELLSKIE
jgi:hypothetical protein